MPRQATIGGRVLVGYLIVLAASGLLALITLVGLNAINAEYLTWAERERQVILEATRLQLHVEQEVAIVRGYLLSASESGPGARARAARTQQVVLSRLQTLVPEGSDQAKLGRIVAAAEGYDRLVDQLFDLRRQGRLTDAVRLLETEEAPARDQLAAELDRFTAGHEVALQEARARLDDRVRMLTTAVAVAAGGMLAAALLFAFRLSRSIAGSVWRLRQGLQRLAGGDLATPVAPETGADVGELSQGLERLRLALAHSAGRSQTVNQQALRYADDLRATLEKEREMVARLKELDQWRSEFVSMVSHDLKTPLASIHDYTTLLVEYRDQLTLEQEAECLTAIRRQAAHLGKLVDDISTVSRLDTDRLPFAFEQVPLEELVRELVDERRLTAERHEVVCALPDEATIVRADPFRLRQVLVNLLDNAIKYSPDGGKVQVRLALRPLDASESPGHPRRAEAVVEVEDEGIGIPAEHLPRLFQKFSRLPQPHQGDIPGTGLGLYICRKIMEAHGGRLWATSTPGQGSTFAFSLPVLSG